VKEVLDRFIIKRSQKKRKLYSNVGLLQREREEGKNRREKARQNDQWARMMKPKIK
jgi:hypothetical protein